MKTVDRTKKFQAGDIVRYADGPTALMKLTSVSLNHGMKGQHLWNGKQFYGSWEGRYEDRLIAATPEEVIKFKTDPHIGRLRDCPELAL